MCKLLVVFAVCEKMSINYTQYRVGSSVLPVHATPSSGSERTSECLYGEIVRYKTPSSAQLERLLPEDSDSGTSEHPNTPDENWLEITLARDEYSGFVQRAHLIPFSVSDDLAATHRVRTTSTLIFAEPSIKSCVLERVPFLAQLVCTKPCDEDFYALDTGGFIWCDHVSAIDQIMAESPLELARVHYLGSPYLWGGCTPQGVDCSGLVQALAIAKGLSIPRDSGDQESSLSATIDVEHRQSQDIVYWPGHTGILLDKDTLLHATAHTLSCVIEALDEVTARAGAISSIKRLFS